MGHIMLNHMISTLEIIEKNNDQGNCPVSGPYCDQEQSIKNGLRECESLCFSSMYEGMNDILKNARL